MFVIQSSLSIYSVNVCEILMFRFVYLATLFALFSWKSFSQENVKPPIQGQSKLQRDSIRHLSDSIAKLDKPKMMFSLSAGPSLCTFSREKYYTDQVPYLQYSLALGFNYLIKKRFAINGLLIWEAKGNKSDYTTGLPAGESRSVEGTSLHYLTLGITTRYYFDSRHRFFGGLGGSLGYLTKNEVYSYFYDLEGNLITDYRSSAHEIKPFEAGLMATLGYNRRLGKKVFLCSQLIGNLGVTNIETDLPAHDPYPTSNASVMLLIGIGIAR
jgi:hypothetical protein